MNWGKGWTVTQKLKKKDIHLRCQQCANKCKQYHFIKIIQCDFRKKGEKKKFKFKSRDYTPSGLVA